MDLKHFRSFCKITRLIGGGLKENDITIIFASTCYIGIRSFYDHTQLGEALAAIALKKKIAYPELLKYVFRVTDELIEQEIQNGNTLMIEYQQMANPYNIALKKKKIGIRRVAPSSSLEKLVIKPTSTINTSLNTHSTDSSVKSKSHVSNGDMKKLKATVKAFSLTDFLITREKEKKIEHLNEILAGKSKDDDDKDLPVGWDNKTGSQSILMTESPG